LLTACLDDIVVTHRPDNVRGKPSEEVMPVARSTRKRLSVMVDGTAAERSEALKKESERALIELIRYRLSLPPEKRLNCLRRKIGLRATCL